MTVLKNIIIVLFFSALLLSGCSDSGDGGKKKISFTREPVNPLYTSSGQTWNFAGIGDPCVIYDDSEPTDKYKMWVSGGGIVPPNPAAIVRTTYLTSPDGITWTENATNPVLLEGLGGADWDRGGVETVTVLKDAGTYYMWYGGYVVREDPPLTLKIGLATSPDGITWTKEPTNPVLDTGSVGAWDESWVESPTVVKVGGIFYMLYTGASHPDPWTFSIGLATSPDGINWTKEAANPVFSAEPANDWENLWVYAPSLLHDGTQFRMWYVGINVTDFFDALQIGMATSPDGITWTRCIDNPVLGLGSVGAWDEKGAFVPTVVLLGTQYKMWYLMGANPNESIGLATWGK